MSLIDVQQLVAWASPVLNWILFTCPPSPCFLSAPPLMLLPRVPPSHAPARVRCTFQVDLEEFMQLMSLKRKEEVEALVAPAPTPHDEADEADEAAEAK